MAGKSPRRKLILDTALDLFCQYGYDGTAVGDIAECLGISKSAITYHFPAKEQLIDDLAGPYLSMVEQVFDQESDSDSPEGIRAIVSRYFDVLVANRNLAVWVDTDRALTRYEPVAERRAKIRRHLIATITGGSKRREDKARALAAIGGLWRPLRILDDTELQDLSDEIIDAALINYQPPAP